MKVAPQLTVATPARLAYQNVDLKAATRDGDATLGLETLEGARAALLCNTAAWRCDHPRPLQTSLFCSKHCRNPGRLLRRALEDSGQSLTVMPLV